jgi:hypothetical protein
MSNKFYIHFRNTTTGDGCTVFLRPTDHALSKLWQSTIRSNFLDNPDSKPLNKKFCFHAWQTEWEQPEYSRNLRIVCEELNHAIIQVNFYYGAVGYPHISLEFNPELLQNAAWYRDAMNELHHHFELLIGQVGNTSEWYYKPENIAACYYVQQLNSLLHEIEATVNNITVGNGERAVLINYAGPRADGSYDPEPVRYELADEHYKCFEDTQHQWGMLVAYYSQLGKQHIEVFIDGDTDIDKQNISGIQYMLGECILQLGERDPYEFPGKRITPKFGEWLVQNGYDPDDDKLALGLGVLARLHTEDNTHVGNTWQEIDSVLRTMDDIYELGFCDEHGTVISNSVYDYTWQEHQASVLRAYSDANI